MKYLCYILDKVSSSNGDKIFHTGECPLAHNLYSFPQTKIKFTIIVFCPNSSEHCPQSRVRHIISLPYSPLQTLRGKCDSCFDNIQDSAQQGGKSGRLLLNLGKITLKQSPMRQLNWDTGLLKFHEIPNYSFGAIS